ncbi:unnamed protein product, partial [Prorocentrum cordatum]
MAPEPGEFIPPALTMSAAAAAAAAAIKTGVRRADAEFERGPPGETEQGFLLRPRRTGGHCTPLPGQEFKAMSTAASPNVTGRLPPRDVAASMPGTPLDASWQRMPVGGLHGLGPLGEGLRRPERSPSPPASARGAPGGTPRTPSAASGAAGTGGTIGRSLDDLSQAPAEARESAWRRREEELKAQIQHLEREKKEVERRLDDDGRQFLEALISLENEVTRLTKQSKRLER